MLFILTFLNLIGGLCYSYSHKNSLLVPWNLYAVFVFAIFGGYEAYAHANGLPLSAEMRKAIFFSILAFFLGLFTWRDYTLKPKRNLECRVEFYRQPYLIKRARVVVAFAMLFFFGLGVYRILSSGASSVGDLYSFDGARRVESAGPVTRMVSLIAKVITPLLFLSFSITFHFRRRQKFLFYIFPIALYLVAIFSGYTGRSNILAILITCLMLHLIYFQKRQVVLIFGMVIISFCLVTALQFLRHGQEIRSISNLVTSIGDGGEWEPVMLLDDLVVYESENTAAVYRDRVKNELYYFFVNWVPRPLWTGKPDTDFAARLSFEYYGHTYGREQNWVRNFTLVGQGYYLGGVMGVAIISFMYGWFCGLLLKIHEKLRLFDFSSCYFVFISAYMLRNAFTTAFFIGLSQLVVGCILAILVYGTTGFFRTKRNA